MVLLLTFIRLLAQNYWARTQIQNGRCPAQYPAQRYISFFTRANDLDARSHAFNCITGAGSTMGSRQDLIDATDFISKHRINPEVSHVLRGLEDAEEGFKLLQAGDQVGKIVIKFPGRTPDGDVRL